MKKVIKWAAVLVGLLLLLTVAAIISLPFLIDPNDYKQEIAQLIEGKTGRHIEIPGAIDLKVSPSLELTFELGSLKMASVSPFKGTPLFSSEHGAVQVSLWPLLKEKQIIVKRLALSDIHLNLIRDKEGRVNWIETAQTGEDTGPGEPVPESPGAGLADIDIGGIDLANINLVFADQMNGTTVRLQELNLQTGHIRPEQQFPLSTDFQLTVDREGQPQMSTTVQLDSKLTLMLKEQRYKAENFTLETTVRSTQLPRGAIALKLAMDCDINLPGQEVSLRNLVVSQEAVELAGNMVLKNFTAPAVNGQLELKEFAPLNYLSGMGITPPPFIDKTALEKLSVALDLSSTPGEISVENIKLSIDDTEAKADVKVVNLMNPEITVKAVIDTLDLDRYKLAAQTEEKGGKPGAAPPTVEKETSLPVEILNTLNFAADLSVAELKVNNLSLSNIEVRASGKDGKISLNPASADLYSGKVAVNGEINTSGAVPKIKISKTVSGVALGPLVTDLTGRQEISGNADIEADVTTSGLTQMELNRNMNGTMSIRLADGEITRLKILDTIRRAKAIIDKEPLVASAAEQPTGFADLSATGVITNGVFSNNDLLAQSDLMKVTGKGSADLASQTIDYLLTVYLTDRVGREEGSGLVALGNRAIPYRVKGTFTELEQSAAVGELIKSEIKNVLMDELQKKLIKEEPAPAKGSSSEPAKKKDVLDPESLIQQGLKSIFGN